MLLRFKIPKESKASRRNSTVLAGDIGATKSNLALFKVEGGNVASLQEAQYKSQEYKNIIELTNTFIKNHSASGFDLLWCSRPGAEWTCETFQYNVGNRQ